MELHVGETFEARNSWQKADITLNEDDLTNILVEHGIQEFETARKLMKNLEALRLLSHEAQFLLAVHQTETWPDEFPVSRLKSIRDDNKKLRDSVLNKYVTFEPEEA